MGERGCPPRLRRFIEEYSDSAFQFAFSLCGSVEQAKELVQEAFFRLIRKWDRYDPARPLDNWFLAILRNVYFDGLKSFEANKVCSLDEEGPLEDPDGETFAETVADSGEEDLLARAERQDCDARVRAALAGLPAEYRAILKLCDLKGMDYRRAAEVLDCTRGAVRSRVWRARLALKERILTLSGEAAFS